jgi:hypothetical protein
MDEVVDAHEASVASSSFGARGLMYALVVQNYRLGKDFVSQLIAPLASPARASGVPRATTTSNCGYPPGSCDSPVDGIATNPATWGCCSWRSDAPSHTTPLPASGGFSTPSVTAASDRPSSRAPATGAGLQAVSNPSRSRPVGHSRAAEPCPNSGAPRSFSPRPIVLRARPVARDDAVIPPCPAVLASAAPNRRRAHSFRSWLTAAYRSRIADAFIIGRG